MAKQHDRSATSHRARHDLGGGGGGRQGADCMRCLTRRVMGGGLKMAGI
jgi:hypothetical protein